MLAFQLWLFATAIVSCVYGESEFTYYGSMGPDHWSEHYNQCAGKHQSPININDVDVIDRRYPEIKYEKFDKKPLNATMTNNGHTVQVKLIYDGQAPMVSGGPLAGKGNYEFQQLHFHWGEDNTVGSEDRINNVSFPMELHIVFRNIRYKDFAEATQRDDGVAVMAFFYEIKNVENKEYEIFVKFLQSGKESRTIRGIELQPLLYLMPLHYDIYYYYTETISAAVCSGRVIWMEFTMPIFLPSNLMKQMSEVLNTSNGAQSNRIHSRQVKVFHSQPIHMVSQLPAVNSIALVDAWDGDVEVIFSSMRLLMFCICILSVWN